MVTSELFGIDPKIQKVVNFANNVAVTKAPILIVGESGTGKRTLGSFIHDKSSRAAGPLLSVDCSEDAQTVENNILGYREVESGRFVKGVLEAGNKGTVIFYNFDALDEVFQKKLHKIFQELPDYDLDIRIIATTTKNLSKLVGSGRFYRGLYTHVSGTQICLPPLRERIGDVEYLAKQFLSQSASEESPFQFSDDALEKLVSHYWTHNILELKTVIEGAVTDSDDQTIGVEDLAIGERKNTSLSQDEDEDGLKLMSLKEAERMLIKKALIHTSENRTQAAKILGVSIRTLRNKINEYRSKGNSYFVNLR